MNLLNTVQEDIHNDNKEGNRLLVGAAIALAFSAGFSWLWMNHGVVAAVAASFVLGFVIFTISEVVHAGSGNRLMTGATFVASILLMLIVVALITNRLPYPM